jgi:hypothetical protein
MKILEFSCFLSQISYDSSFMNVSKEVCIELLLCDSKVYSTVFLQKLVTECATATA